MTATLRTKPDKRVSARRWPKRLTPAEREQLLIDTLVFLGGWVDVPTIHRVAAERNPSFKVAHGTTGAILQKLADAGRICRRTRGTTSAYCAPASASRTGEQ